MKRLLRAVVITIDVLVLVFAALSIAPADARHRHHRLTDHERIAVLRWQVRELTKAVKDLGVPRQVEHSINASKHAWPDLTDEEKASLTEVLKSIPKAVKFDIVCNDASCTDLAMDIDDAMEKAGLESVLDRSLGPLGYGMDIQVNAFDHEAAVAATAALKKATAGRIDLPVTEAPKGANLPGYVTIRIGKYQPPAPAAK